MGVQGTRDEQAACVDEPLHHPSPEEFQLTDILHALSDPIRLDLVRQLDTGDVERTCKSFDLPIAKSTATHHWRVLREAGVVRARVEGTKKYHRLRKDEVNQRFPGLLDSILASADPASAPPRSP
ncbi:MAG TPA: helix-turn-helix transcriptional regulator [Acidimicrobiales bacterium]|jgi:DNA-binding transcriptional ArsR family regulator|nr:helix-turn-helix transcriptional regulator [Acidimicrobiales bacterium]